MEMQHPNKLMMLKTQLNRHRDYVEAKSNLRADKSQLQSAYDTLNRDVLTNDKKPASVRRYNEAISNIRKELDTAKADATLRNTNPSVEQVRDALNKINTVQPKSESSNCFNQKKIIQNLYKLKTFTRL